MTDERDINRGAIWGNRQKTKPTHPDFKGSINVGGIEYWLDGWKRPADANDRAPSMKFMVRPKEAPEVAKPVEDSARTEQRFRESVKQHFPGDLNDDIPFAPEVR